MKAFIKKMSLSTLATILSLAAFSQSNLDISLTYHKKEILEKVNEEVKPTSSNELIIKENIINYLHSNLEWPENVEGFYNSNVTVTVTFLISETGAIEEIQVPGKKDKLVEEAVILTLKKLGTVAPIIENGEVIRKRYMIPVVFSH